MQKLLEGRCAIVTGAGRGIGRAAAALLIEQGARVLISDIDGAVVRQCAHDLGGEAFALEADLTQTGAAERIVEAAIDEMGAIDIVVNNAGYTRSAPVVKMSDEVWQSMLDIHTTIPFRILRAAGPHMIAAARRDAEQGREVFRKVVNISSTAVQGAYTMANYSAAKAAIIGLTRSLALEWAEHRINVNAVAFGAVETRLTASKADNNAIDIGGETHSLGLPDSARSNLLGRLPFGRFATPEEAAGGIFLLCTPWSNWIHGQVLTVNGGQGGGMSV